MMNEKQILKNLISLYKTVIELCKDRSSVDTIDEIICTYKVNMGICRAAFFMFGEQIYGRHWVMKGIKKDKFWHSIPERLKSKRGKLRALQYRLDKMNKILLEIKK